MLKKALRGTAQIEEKTGLVKFFRNASIAAIVNFFQYIMSSLLHEKKCLKLISHLLWLRIQHIVKVEENAK